MWKRIYAHVSRQFLSLYCLVLHCSCDKPAVSGCNHCTQCISTPTADFMIFVIWNIVVFGWPCLLFSCGRVLAFGTLHLCFIDWSLQLEATSSRLLLLPHQEDPSCVGDTILEFRVLSCEEGVGIKGGNVKLYHSSMGHLYVLHLQVQSGCQPSGP